MKISGTSGAGAIAPAVERSLAQPAGLVPSAKLEDEVTLSSTAQSRAAASAHPRFGEVSAKAHANPELAEQLSYDYSHMAQPPLYDYSEYNAGGIVRYSGTGEIVTPESEARYRQQGESLQAASLDLYNQEKAKGTDPADIFDKLIALGDSQSAEFRTIINWEGQAG